jgi:hypothetical protein
MRTWYFTSIHSKMNLKGPKSMRKVVSLILIDFYVPGLTPRFNSTEASLQLSENIPLFAVCRIYTTALVRHQVFGTYHYIYVTVQCGGQGGTLWHPCLYIGQSSHIILERTHRERRLQHLLLRDITAHVMRSYTACVRAVT